MRRIERSLEGTDLPSRIRRIVLLGTWDDLDRSKKGAYGEAHAQKVNLLAKEYLGQPQLHESIVLQLTREPGMSVVGFGFGLGQHDAEFMLWESLLNTFLSCGDARRSELLDGYLAAMFGRARRIWETEAIRLMKNPVTQRYLGDLVIGTGMTETVLDGLCDLVERREIADESLQRFPFARALGPITVDRCMEFVSWCISHSRPALMTCALETAYLLFCFGAEPQPIPEHPILELLATAGVIQDRDQSAYQWSQLTERFVSIYPGYVVRIFEHVMLGFHDSDVALRVTHSQSHQTLVSLIRLNPHGTWQVIARLMDSAEDRRTWHIAHWLGERTGFGEDLIPGPLSAFDADDVLAWVCENPMKRAHFVARQCPKTFDAFAGRITREVLIRYGHFDGVQNAFHANFETESISGPLSEHYRRKRERMQTWLASETELPIIAWLESHIRDLGQRIRYEEMREERQY